MKGTAKPDQGELQVVRIDELCEAPVHIHTHSRKQTAHVSDDIVKNGTEKTVVVASFRGRKYIIDGHLIVEAYRKIGKKTIISRVHVAKSEQDVIAMHVRHNMGNPPNPVQLLQAVMYMRKRNDADEDIARRLGMNKLVARILRFTVNERALDELESLIKDISAVYYSAHHAFPMPLLEWVFRQHVDTQHGAAIALHEIVMESCGGSEHRFVWPTMMEARIRQNYNNQKDTSTEEPVTVTLITHSEGTRGRPPRGAKGEAEGVPVEGMMSEINSSTPSSRRRIAFKCPHGETIYVDAKMRAYRLENSEKDGVVYVRRIDGEEGIYQIPARSIRFMGAKRGTVYIKEFSASGLARLVPELKRRKLDVCVLSSEEL